MTNLTNMARVVGHTNRFNLEPNQPAQSAMHPSDVIEVPELKELAIERLDNEIRVLTEQLRLLKAQRNGFSS